MRFFFDFLIILTLLFSGYWIFWISRSFFVNQPGNPRTKLMRAILLSGLLLIFVAVFWGSFIEPRLIRVTKKQLWLNDLNTPLTIAFIADTHLGPFKKNAFMEKVATKIATEKPDLLLLGGDYLIFKEANARYLAPLKKITATIPTYAVTGNHEYAQGFAGDPNYKDKTGLLREVFADLGITLLENENEIIDLHGQRLAIAGITDIWTGRADIKKAAAGTAAVPGILLAHNPEAALLPGAENFDLILSGHTHAGQLRLPFIGALAYPDNVSRQFTYGEYTLPTGTSLLVTAGLGESGGLRARFFNRPEIMILSLSGK